MSYQAKFRCSRAHLGTYGAARHKVAGRTGWALLFHELGCQKVSAKGHAKEPRSKGAAGRARGAAAINHRQNSIRNRYVDERKKEECELQKVLFPKVVQTSHEASTL